MQNVNQAITTESNYVRLNITALEKLLGCSRQTIWRWYSDRDFPRPHFLGQNRLWFMAEVEGWLQKQMLSHAANSFYTMSGSSPPNVTSSKGGAK